MAKYEIAGVIFDFTPRFEQLKRTYEEFAYAGDRPAELSLSATAEMVENLKKDLGIPDKNPDILLEDLLFEKTVSDYILNNKNGTLFHSSAIEYKGGAYVFTGKSGAGKSTHAKLWRETFGDRIRMINDDKPFLRLIDGVPTMYGSPWKGKHHIGGNITAPLKAICRVVQSDRNEIRELSVKEFLPTFFVQCYFPQEKEPRERFLEFLDGLLGKVKLYELCCNISEEAARLSFSAMTGEKI